MRTSREPITPSASIPRWKQLLALGGAVTGIFLLADNVSLPPKPAIVCEVSGETHKATLENIQEVKDQILPADDPCRPTLETIVGRLLDRMEQADEHKIDIPTVTHG